MITIIWIATAVTVLGSIELLARAATSKRSAVEATLIVPAAHDR